MESVGIIIFNKQFGFDGIGRNYHFYIKMFGLDGIGRNIYF